MEQHSNGDMITGRSSQAMSAPELSVVVIARNEENVIGRCLDSVVHAVSHRNAEILFVDSASTDRTVEIAQCYPIGIVRLDPHLPLSPSAGRWLGTRLTNGEYLFFVDGDMVVIDGWLAHALEVLGNQHVAAVGGRLFWILPGEELHLGRRDDFPLGQVPGLGGAGVYRRRALQECGTYNPFLRGEEERELAYRLSSGGYTVERVEAPMAYHLNKPRSVQENVERAIYFRGVGQIMRHYALRRIFWDLLKEQREPFLFWAFVIVLFLLFAGSTARHSHLALTALAAVTLLGATALAIWKGFRRVWLYLHEQWLYGVRFLQGLMIGLPPADRYPERFIREKQ
jgi:glycosyltransferase involved in cell wall biosynthesis